MLKPKSITQQSLRNAGLRYLEKYAASTQSLRDVLNRRTSKCQSPDDPDPYILEQWIEDIIQQFTNAGLLNDQLFAQARAETLFNKGASIQMIRSKLTQKGIASVILDEIIANLIEEWKNPDLKAAIRFSQRKKIGPFRIRGDRAVFIKRDLASLGRAGFSFEVAKKIVHAVDSEALDEDDGY